MDSVHFPLFLFFDLPSIELGGSGRPSTTPVVAGTPVARATESH